MNETTHMISKMARVCSSIIVGLAMLWFAANEFFTRPTVLSSGIVLERRYVFIALYAFSGLWFLWLAFDSLMHRRRRTLGWDDDALTIRYAGKEKVIRWVDLQHVTEDQIAYQLFTEKSWSGYELSKSGLPEELNAILRRKVETVD